MAGGKSLGMMTLPVQSAHPRSRAFSSTSSDGRFFGVLVVASAFGHRPRGVHVRDLLRLLDMRRVEHRADLLEVLD